MTVRLTKDFEDRLRDHELELCPVTIAPGGDACAWAFAHWLFRPEKVSWDGPAQVNWLGHLYDSPFDPREWPDRYGPAPSDVDPNRRRVHVIGDPVCFVVRNPTDAPLEVTLRVAGKIVVNGERR